MRLEFVTLCWLFGALCPLRNWFMTHCQLLQTQVLLLNNFFACNHLQNFQLFRKKKKLLDDLHSFYLLVVYLCLSGLLHYYFFVLSLKLSIDSDFSYLAVPAKCQDILCLRDLTLVEAKI